MFREKGLIVLYFIIMVVEMIAEYVQIQPLIYASKPLLMVILFGWFYQSNQKPSQNRFKKLILFSIAFAFGGDTLLMFVPNNEIYFLLGLGSFLIAQLFYGFAFVNSVKSTDSFSLDKTDLLIAVWFAIFYFVLMYILYPYLNEYLIPVLLYGVAISFMGVTAAMRSGRVASKSFKLVLFGALLFIVSDSIIAFNQFIYNRELWNAQILIMSTYSLGQYYLIAGCKAHLSPKSVD